MNPRRFAASPSRAARRTAWGFRRFPGPIPGSSRRPPPTRYETRTACAQTRPAGAQPPRAGTWASAGGGAQTARAGTSANAGGGAQTPRTGTSASARAGAQPLRAGTWAGAGGGAQTPRTGTSANAGGGAQTPRTGTSASARAGADGAHGDLGERRRERVANTPSLPYAAHCCPRPRTSGHGDRWRGGWPTHPHCHTPRLAATPADSQRHAAGSTLQPARIRSASIAANPIVSPSAIAVPWSLACSATAAATAGATSRLKTDGTM
jgi:hypothetical protein